MYSTVFDLTPWRWKLATADIQCVMAEKTECQLKSLLRRWKINGSHLNPGSFEDYCQYLIPAPEGWLIYGAAVDSVLLGCDLFCYVKLVKITVQPLKNKLNW